MLSNQPTNCRYYTNYVDITLTIHKCHIESLFVSLDAGLSAYGFDYCNYFTTSFCIVEQIHEKLRQYERQSPAPILHSASTLAEDVRLTHTQCLWTCGAVSAHKHTHTLYDLWTAVDHTE